MMISNMFATHTMVSYPVVTRLGLSKNEAVAVATGGTVITDTIVLLVLAAITGTATGGTGFILYVKLLLSFILFLLFVVFLIPPVSRWAFRRLEDDNYSQFIYAAFVVFLCAIVAMAAGLEPIIGAFAAGFVLNRLIPAESILRNRIDFIGNALFIPFFLISVGMIADLKIIISSPTALIVAAVLTAAALAGKFAAAEIASRILGFSRNQGRLLFGLTSSHAAAILAVIMVGYRIGIIDENVINGTIVLILVTCFVSSWVTETAGRNIILAGNGRPKYHDDRPYETIIISLSNPLNMERLLDLALTLKKKNHSNPLYGLCVVNDDDAATEKLELARETLDRAGVRALASGRKIETLATIDINITAGIKRVAKEKSATDIIVGTPGKSNLADLLFGRSVEQLIINSPQNVFVYNPVNLINLYRKVILFVPPFAEKEYGFPNILDKAVRISESNAVPFETWSFGLTSTAIEDHLRRIKSTATHYHFSFPDEKETPDVNMTIRTDDLVVIVAPQRGNVSYTQSFDSFMKKILKVAGENGYLIIYPGVLRS
jgi:Kef-type K+ transport system membrane component KefB